MTTASTNDTAAIFSVVIDVGEQLRQPAMDMLGIDLRAAPASRVRPPYCQACRDRSRRAARRDIGIVMQR